MVFLTCQVLELPERLDRKLNIERFARGPIISNKLILYFDPTFSRARCSGPQQTPSYYPLYASILLPLAYQRSHFWLDTLSQMYTFSQNQKGNILANTLA